MSFSWADRDEGQGTFLSFSPTPETLAANLFSIAKSERYLREKTFQ